MALRARSSAKINAPMPEKRVDPELLSEGLVDWEQRLAEERGLLERVLSRAPSKRILDLGCGSGRHARLLAESGYEVVGLDASETAIDLAQREPVPRGAQFIMTDLGAVERSVQGHFGAAICIGNTLPYLLSTESLSRMLIGLKRRLLPGAPLLLQTLNYDRIPVGVDTLMPTRLVPREDGNLLVVRLARAREDGFVLHTATVLRHLPSSDEVMEVVGTQRWQLRGWKREELETLLEVARFEIRQSFGDMAMATWKSESSPELVLVAG
jgi:2-polyprenyl-3-methyl-5-hydroxy-6-metoxy-1,4-benzoquinol methylase